MIIRNYSFAISVLYQTMRIVLKNCKNNVVAFAAFKSKYTAALIAALEDELNAAERMKGEQARSLEHESLRVQMLPLAETCRELWQHLKSYIAEMVGPDLEIKNWDAAGWQYYGESNANWDKLREMCNMANVYIADNEASLKTLGYMPATFKDAFNKATVLFNDKYDAFLLAQENAMQGTSDKVAANNAIFAKVSAICTDGQIIFMKDDVKKSLFSMQAVSELVKPVGAAGLKGVVTQNGKAQAGLIVELENESLHVITDADGAFDFGNQLASGKDTLIIRNGDEILAENEVVINPGVTKRENVILPVPITAKEETTTPTTPIA